MTNDTEKKGDDMCSPLWEKVATGGSRGHITWNLFGLWKRKRQKDNAQG